ncbi:hypothetical protein AV530_018330 [Patagioenas fasciata monilis]|uniref:Uncharacterized protein n=1 Tax=Patagioenas fasciata monilis TaxID=372326 RepID=A0A1V4JRL8_PATFA|nr:hypothetical protein AV530_018330 [Patagioenas fasciata monilis]
MDLVSISYNCLGTWPVLIHKHHRGALLLGYILQFECVRLDAQQGASPVLCVPVVSADPEPDHQLRHLEREKLFLFEIQNLSPDCSESAVPALGEAERWELPSPAGKSPTRSVSGVTLRSAAAESEKRREDGIEEYPFSLETAFSLA